ncbi:MAG: Uma2 family endonuclease [Oscillatoria sp. PMC 1051.18]|nr:Uma2 family endonuclease [Oscillatoria sp. PMC 1050.18]MEC5028841.1 Uma2 family endonuclease [Oscillatoria sp. PMC 1051.18]
MQTKNKTSLSPEEYLDFEINSDERHHYLNGEIILMAGGTPNHNQIALNLGGTLNFILKRKPVRVFVADQRLWIPDKRLYTYPDVMVISGELELQSGRKDTILNPLVIAEVLSKSTEAFDRGEKFSAYRTISGFQEYILIDQYTYNVEQFTKTESGQWLLSEYQGEQAVLSLHSLEFEISLAELYDRVDFQ